MRTWYHMRTYTRASGSTSWDSIPTSTAEKGPTSFPLAKSTHEGVSSNFKQSQSQLRSEGGNKDARDTTPTTAAVNKTK